MATAARTSAPLSRRERRKREVHARILEAAVELFDAHGVAETTVAAICEQADVAEKTFFNHFPSRQQLLRAIATDALEETLRRIDAAIAGPGPTEARLRRFFDELAVSSSEAGPMHRELLTEIVHQAHEEGSEGEQARRLHEAFARLVRQGIEAGDVDARHGVETAAEMVTGAFYVLMLNWAHLDEYPLRTRADAAARFLGRALAPVRPRRRGR